MKYATTMQLSQTSAGTKLEIRDEKGAILDEYILGSQPKPVPPKAKKRVLLDPGHSKAEPGARGNDGTAKEEELNLLQAEVIAQELQAAGIAADIFNPQVDDLRAIGAKAKGYDAFISLHHNSYSGNSDPGCEVFVPVGAYASDRKAAQAVVNAISTSLKTQNRGVKEANFAVIRTAGEVSDGIVMLIESYFLNPYSAETAKKRSLQAADAIADTLIDLLS